MGEREREKRGDKARWQRLKDRLDDLDPHAVPDDLLHLIRAVTGARDPALTCEECQAWLPSYVDAEVGGLAVGQLYPHIKRHLELCTTCEAVYLEMLELAEAEEAGILPSFDESPEPDLAFLGPLSLSEYVRSLAEELAAATAPHLVADLRAIGDVFFERIARLGGEFILGPRLAPAMGFGAEEVPEALKFLAATYVTTLTLTRSMSPQEIKAQAETGQLWEAVCRQAEQAARDLGVSDRVTQSFARKCAELMSRDPQVLQDLATGSHGDL